MLRFYFRLTASLMLVFITTSLVLSAIGSTQPMNPALRGFVEGCEGMPQPMLVWHSAINDDVS
ncbi:MAG: hypothetical protein U0694_04345 [Anaerolineae bacterium]